jgi:hypothetical protein
VTSGNCPVPQSQWAPDPRPPDSANNNQQPTTATTSNKQQEATRSNKQLQSARRARARRALCTPPSRYMIYGLGRPHGAFAAISEVCSVITQRARVQQRPSQRPPPFLHVPPRALWLECGPVEKKKRPPPSRQGATWLAACRRREKRPSSSTRQANKVGRMSRRASRI